MQRRPIAGTRGSLPGERPVGPAFACSINGLRRRLEAEAAGGHSSVPRAESTISRMARTLADLADHRFEISLNETTRALLELWRDFAPAQDGELIGAWLSRT